MLEEQARSQKFAMGWAVLGVWGRSPQPLEANGGLGLHKPMGGARAPCLSSPLFAVLCRYSSSKILSSPTGFTELRSSILTWNSETGFFSKKKAFFSFVFDKSMFVCIFLKKTRSFFYTFYILQVADHCKIVLRIEIPDPEANFSTTCLLIIADVWKICKIDMHDRLRFVIRYYLTLFPPFCANLSLFLVGLCFWIRTVALVM